MPPQALKNGTGPVFLAMSLLAAPLIATTAAGTSTDAGTEPAQTQERSPHAAERSRQVAGDLAQSWWKNEAIVQAIGLTSEQDSRLDELLATALADRSQSQDRLRDGLRQFSEALKSGSQEAASLQIERISTETGLQAKIRADLMRQGVGVLQEAQRDLLARDFPFVFSRSWLGGANPWQVRARSAGLKAKSSWEPVKKDSGTRN